MRNKIYETPVTEIAVQDLMLMTWEEWVSNVAEPGILPMTTFRPHPATPGGSPLK